MNTVDSIPTSTVTAEEQKPDAKQSDDRLDDAIFVEETLRPIQAEVLRGQIISTLKRQGFQVTDRGVALPNDVQKERIRQLHALAVRHRIHEGRGLRRHEHRLLGYIAGGSEVVPEKISPTLVEVSRGSEEELLFRYARLHWSIPISAGYGRRLRFLVFDENNGKLIGLFGLGDPVFSLRRRDDWVGWDKSTREQRLQHVMDAFVLGAVPPYSFLLGGKLVAMLAASNEVRQAFARKYTDRITWIRGRSQDGHLAMLTTTSALGRSSIYNRVKYRNRLLFQSVGFTKGSGEFHFSNEIYEAMAAYVLATCQPTAKHERWGNGYRNRREIVVKCLKGLGLSQDWLYHGIQREIFVVPLARNTREFLRGQTDLLEPYDQPARELFAWFRERWLLPRARRNDRYRAFDPESWRLWD